MTEPVKSWDPDDIYLETLKRVAALEPNGVTPVPAGLRIPPDYRPGSGEVRTVSPTGGEKGQKLERFDLIPVLPLAEVARLYGAGASKYADRNWELGYAWSLSYAAMQRHANLFWGGESTDPETKRHHLAAVIFHAMALMEYEYKGKGTDDRAR